MKTIQSKQIFKTNFIMKKFMSIFIASLFLFALTACGGGETEACANDCTKECCSGDTTDESATEEVTK